MRKFLFLIPFLTAACSAIDVQVVPAPIHSFSIQADMVDAQTRALELNEKTVSSFWNTGDAVYVYNETTGETLGGTLSPESTGGKTTTLTGNLTGMVSPGDNLRLFLGGVVADYRNQESYWWHLIDHYDFRAAVSPVTVVSIENNSVSLSGLATFEAQQALVHFIFLDKASGDEIHPVDLEFKAMQGSENTLVSQYDMITGTETFADSFQLTRGTSFSPCFMAFRGVGNANGGSTLYISASTSTSAIDPSTLSPTIVKDYYEYERANVTFQNGKFYEITVRMSKRAKRDGVINLNCYEMTYTPGLPGPYHLIVSGENSGQYSVECHPGSAATVSYQLGGNVYISIDVITNCQFEVVVSSAETDYYSAATAVCLFNPNTYSPPEPSAPPGGGGNPDPYDLDPYDDPL